jgi:hypothetical protein
MPARKSVLLGITAACVFLVLALPGRAAAHGDCSQGSVVDDKTTIWSQYNLPNYDKVHGYIRFLCEGNEVHHKIFVHVRLYKCHRLTYQCDGPLILVAGVTKYCYDTYYCIRQTGWTACQERYKFFAYGRWRAWNRSGVVVHQNPAWPNLNRELPSFAGTVGTNC